MASAASLYGIHSGYYHPLLRAWQASVSDQLSSEQFMLPLFVINDVDAVEPIVSMPGVSRMGINPLLEYLRPVVSDGLKSVLLFPVISQQDKKDPMGTLGTDSDHNPLLKAIPALKKAFPELLVSCDVCMCAYTDHGHCGILKEDGFIDNEASVAKLTAIARAFVEVGADMIAPSDMMDGRVKSIKDMLKAAGAVNRVSVMSYSVKFSSGFYGPFRDAANSAPAFGDRKRYQLPVASRGLALRAADRDVYEGADLLMVKPGLAYLDVVREVKNRHPELPMAIYQVSGEYAMLYHAAKNGAFDLRNVLLETFSCMRRAGADVIISYYTPEVLKWIANK